MVSIWWDAITPAPCHKCGHTQSRVWIATRSFVFIVPVYFTRMRTPRGTSCTAGKVVMRRRKNHTVRNQNHAIFIRGARKRHGYLLVRIIPLLYLYIYLWYALLDTGLVQKMMFVPRYVCITTYLVGSKPKLLGLDHVLLLKVKELFSHLFFA